MRVIEVSGGMMNDAGNLVAATVGGAVDKGKEKVTGVAKRCIRWS